MDISLIPLNIYKIPKDCVEVLVSSNLMYTIQLFPKDIENRELRMSDDSKNMITVIGVVGCNTTALCIGEDSV